MEVLRGVREDMTRDANALIWYMYCSTHSQLMQLIAMAEWLSQQLAAFGGRV